MNRYHDGSCHAVGHDEIGAVIDISLQAAQMTRHGELLAKAKWGHGGICPGFGQQVCSVPRGIADQDKLLCLLQLICHRPGEVTGIAADSGKIAGDGAYIQAKIHDRDIFSYSSAVPKDNTQDCCI